MSQNFTMNGVVISALLAVMLSTCDNGGSSKDRLVIKFTEVTEEAGLNYSVESNETVGDYEEEAGGVAVLDIDGDGDLDFFVVHALKEPGRLFENMGDGTFTDVTNQSGILTNSKASGASFIDVDQDGISDLLITQIPSVASPASLLVYRNDGAGQFSDITAATGLAPTSDQIRSISGGDFDKDGDIDIVMTPHGQRPVVDANEGYLWENVNGVFSDVTSMLPVPDHNYALNPSLAETVQWGFTPSFSDVNQDGYVDLLYVSGFDNTQWYKNEAGASFSLQSDVFTDEAGMGSAIGDYDNDGDLDWFISSVWHPDKSWNPFGEGNSGNRFYQNDGAGNFADVTDEAGVREGYFGWGACFGDFDNDGDLDLFHVNGLGERESYPGPLYAFFKDDPAIFYLNNGDATFTEMAVEIGIEHKGQGRGVSCLDYDNDGDLDLLIGNNGASPHLYRNDTNKVNNYIDVRLKGLTKNAQGAGAKVKITHVGRSQLRELRLGSNYLSNNPMIAHFGLGADTEVDKIEVIWEDPADSISVVNQPEVNQLITITHPNR